MSVTISSTGISSAFALKTFDTFIDAICDLFPMYAYALFTPVLKNGLFVS